MPEHVQTWVEPQETDTPGVKVMAVSGRTSLRLKSWLPEHTKGARAVTLGGRALPSQVGATLSGPTQVLCVGPGEWLLVSQEREAPSLRESLEPDLSAQGLVCVDLTDGLAVLEVRGAAVREILSKGCGLDFHPHSFPAGRCARTRFAQIPLVVACFDEPPRFELYVARSYFHYLHSWLTDAAAEFATTSQESDGAD